jgi:hypothetical protein
MEHFGARDERPAEECIRLVRTESDVFVGIYAHRYGHIPEDAQCSVCEMEYKAASEASLPRFVYLVDDTYPWIPKHIDTGDAGTKLQAFKDGLRKRHICQTFQDEHHLAVRVVADVGRHIASQIATVVGPGIPVHDIGLESMRCAALETPHEWNDRRKGIYAENRGIFLAHFIRPSLKEGQSFDVFIYLVRHKSEDFSDVRVAEFFLGPYWDNKVFPEVEKSGFIGIATSAYGTFLCLCRVTFDDGSEVYLERYIDFEQQRTGGT